MEEVPLSLPDMAVSRSRCTYDTCTSMRVVARDSRTARSAHPRDDHLSSPAGKEIVYRHLGDTGSSKVLFCKTVAPVHTLKPEASNPQPFGEDLQERSVWGSWRFSFQVSDTCTMCGLRCECWGPRHKLVWHVERRLNLWSHLVH